MLFRSAPGREPDEGKYMVIRELRSKVSGNGLLGIWEAGGVPPGIYSLRLTVVKNNDADWFEPRCVIEVELQ